MERVLPVRVHRLCGMCCCTCMPALAPAAAGSAAAAAGSACAAAASGAAPPAASGAGAAAAASEGTAAFAAPGPASARAASQNFASSGLSSRTPGTCAGQFPSLVCPCRTRRNTPRLCSMVWAAGRTLGRHHPPDSSDTQRQASSSRNSASIERYRRMLPRSLYWTCQSPAGRTVVDNICKVPQSAVFTWSTCCR